MRCSLHFAANNRIFVNKFKPAFVERKWLEAAGRLSLEFKDILFGYWTFNFTRILLNLKTSAVFVLDYMVIVTLEEGLVAEFFARPIINEKPLHLFELVINVLKFNLFAIRDVGSFEVGSRLQ